MHSRRLPWVSAAPALLALVLGGCGSTDGNRNVTAPGARTSGAATGAEAGLRQPRQLRSARTVRSSADRAMSAPAPSAAQSHTAAPGSAAAGGSPSAPAGSPGLASFNEASRSGSVTAGGSRYTFSGTGRAFDVTPASGAANSTAGRTTAAPSITYDPVTRTWKWN